MTVPGSRRARTLPPTSVEDHVDAELAHHLAELEDRLLDSGWSADEAPAEARRRLGDAHRWRSATMAEHGELVRRRWTMNAMDTLIHDVRHAVRALRKNPGFAWTFIATLGLGVGATGAIFSVVDAVMLRPLPFEASERLVQARLTTGDGFLLDLGPVQVRGWERSADFLEAMAVHERISVVREDGEDPELLGAVAVSPDMGSVLGVDAARGRLFTADDAVPGVRTAILTWAYWVGMGSPMDAVGSQIVLDGESWTVVGALPRSVEYPVSGTVDVWIPLSSDYTGFGRPLDRMGLVGRLADGVDVAAAQERASVLVHAIAEEANDPLPVGWDVMVQSLEDRRVNQSARTGLVMVTAAVGLMFLIALVNGINLLLVRSWDRGGEVSVRRALGASRVRVAGQIFVESVVLALLGGVLAAGVAAACVMGVEAIAPDDLTMLMLYDFGLEGRSIAVVFATAVVAGLLVAPLPAIAAATTRIHGGGAVRQRGRERSGMRLRSGLVGVQVALAVVLLVGAGLFLRSFSLMMGQDHGMEADRLAMVSVRLPDSRYSEAATRSAFAAEVLERIRRLPGVSSAVVAHGAPPDGYGITFGDGVQGEGRAALTGGHYLPMAYVPEGYLATLGTTLVSGRDFTADDVAARHVIIDSDFAERAFGRVDVAGSRVRLSEDGDWREVVGVVAEIRLGGVDDRLSDMALLRPLDLDEVSNFPTFIARAAEPRAILPEIRSVIRSIDPRQPLTFLGTGEDALGDDAIRPRFLVLLMSVLSAVAVTLAGIGVYGVLSFVVRQRQREVGIRIALGAPLGRIRRGLLSWGLRVGGAGTLAGLLITTRFSAAVDPLLYRIDAGDLTTRVGAIGAIMLVVMGACLLPAARAIRADPVDVLRADQN